MKLISDKNIIKNITKNITKMKITFKTLTGLSLEIYVADDWTIIGLMHSLFVKKICPTIFNNKCSLYQLLIKGKDIKLLGIFEKLDNYSDNNSLTIHVVLNLGAYGRVIGTLYSISNDLYQKIIESFDNNKIEDCLIYHDLYKDTRKIGKCLEKIPVELRRNLM